MGNVNAESANPIDALTKPLEFDPDHPISPKSRKDRLGFRDVANKLAASLLSQSKERCLVVSIEGAWGSGKSSLVNLLAAEIEESKNAPKVLKFEPWLVSNRDAMLTELMSELATTVELIEAPNLTKNQLFKKKSKNIAEKLRTFAPMSFLRHQS